MDPRTQTLRRANQSEEAREARKFLCPFGCGEAQSDDHGYCKHLVGFTDDGKTMEARLVNREGTKQKTAKDAKAGVEVLQTDIVVDTGYVTARVYRAMSKTDVPLQRGQVRETELQGMLADLDARMKALEAENRELRALAGK